MTDRTFRQGNPEIPASPRVDQTHYPMPGEEHVSDVRDRVRVTVPTPDARIFESWDAPLARAATVPQAFTVRDTLGEDRVLSGMKVLPDSLPAAPDPLQSMQDGDLRRGNSFRAVPEPYDEGMIR